MSYLSLDAIDWRGITIGDTFISTHILFLTEHAHAFF